MAETIAELASLLKLGPDAPLQPPRFAKVVSVSGDTVTVTLGGSNADAVRCCACAADDIVLLETMPSGQLAAVATKGASGGGTSPENLSYYGTCSTAAGTAAKVVTCAGFVLATGARISVLFTTAQAAQTGLTLNVNGTGAIAVWKDGAQPVNDGNCPVWPTANVTAEFIYDGSHWAFLGATGIMHGPRTLPTNLNNMTGRGGIFQHYYLGATVTNGTGKAGHYFHMQSATSNYLESQFFVPIAAGGRPAWRTNPNGTWTAWDYIYTDANPPKPTLDSGGPTKEEVLAGTDTDQWHTGWREEKYPDGRLTKWKWQRFSCVSGYNALSTGVSSGTAFTSRPDISVTVGPLLNSSYSPISGYYAQGGIQDYTLNTTCVVGAHCGTAGMVFVEIRMDGFWV